MTIGRKSKYVSSKDKVLCNGGFIDGLFEVNRISTIEYGLSVAKRPFNSRLDKSKLTESGFSLLPHWKDALKRYLSKLS